MYGIRVHVNVVVDWHEQREDGGSGCFVLLFLDGIFLRFLVF